MARYILLALNGPTAGAEDEPIYNHWYDHIHLPDLLAIPGVVAARRFRVVRGRRAEWPYVALYEIECGDPDLLLNQLATQTRPFTPAFDRETSAFLLAEAMDPPG